MLKMTMAAAAVTAALACSSASAATYTLPWTGTYTQSSAFGGCDDDPNGTDPCTAVFDVSGTLTITVDSDADGEFTGSAVTVDAGWNDWMISGSDAWYLDLVVHDGWVNSLEAIGPSQTGLSTFSVYVVNGAGSLDFLDQYSHASQELVATIAVPEPASAALLLAGIPLVAWRRRRQ